MKNFSFEFFLKSENRNIDFIGENTLWERQMFDDSLWNWWTGELLMTDRDVSVLIGRDQLSSAVCVCYTTLHAQEFKGATCKILV